MSIFDEAVESVKRRGFYGIVPGLSDHAPIMAQFLRSVEEKGELARALRKHDGSDETYQNICDELADGVITYASMAYMLGVDLEKAIREKLAKDEQRGRLHGEGNQ